MQKVSKIIKEEYKRFFIVLLGSVLYAIGLVWFLQPAKLYSGGVIGLVQLILNIIEKYTSQTYSMGVFIFLINVPILVVAFKYISLRFAIYSLLSIVIQSIMTMGFIPIPDFGMITNDMFAQAFFGGCLVGVGGAMTLRFGASTGGIDVFAQVYALRKNVSIGLFTLAFNVTVAVIAGIMFGWYIALYTIIRIITTSVVTDKIHTTYNHMKMEVITEKGEEISNLIMLELGRGVTVISAEGAYSHKKKYVLEIVLSSFELYKIINDIKKIDDKVFIVASPVKSLVGNFKKRTVA